MGSGTRAQIIKIEKDGDLYKNGGLREGRENSALLQKRKTTALKTALSDTFNLEDHGRTKSRLGKKKYISLHSRVGPSCFSLGREVR